MNYRHAFHAGNFADVLKHLVLAQCLEHLGDKPKPYRVIDTHAGVGAYDLTGDEARRSPEWTHGIDRLMKADIPAEIRDSLDPYLNVVRAMNPGEALTTYPGSPEIAARLARAEDRIHLCELHKDDSVTLDKRYARDARVKVQAMDGYRALPGLVPPREKRGLVMIDPPFEHRDEMAFMAQAAKSALERWPTGTFIFWRPLKDLWAQERFDVGLAEWLIADQGLEGEKLLRADMWVRELNEDGPLAGAGVVVVNPPFKLEERLLKLLPWLTELLAQDEDAGWRLDGCINDDSLMVDEF